jgi:hypothetical protein
VKLRYKVNFIWNDPRNAFEDSLSTQNIVSDGTQNLLSSDSEHLKLPHLVEEGGGGGEEELKELRRAALRVEDSIRRGSELHRAIKQWLHSVVDRFLPRNGNMMNTDDPSTCSNQSREVSQLDHKVIKQRLAELKRRLAMKSILFSSVYLGVTARILRL